MVISNWFPESVSTFGGEIDSVFFLIYYIVGVWFILTEGAIVLFAIRYRQRSGHRATPHRGDTAKELAWLLVPALIILGLDLGIDVAGSDAWAKIKVKPPAGEVLLRVTAKQFNWGFTYPGPDGKFGTDDDLTMDNVIHVPVGKVVRLTLMSEDVIHGFFVPSLRLKQDVVPGRRIDSWFKATKPGTYEIACSELCGFGHSGMRGFLKVESQEDYARWVNEQWPTAGTQAEPAVGPAAG